MRSDLKFSQTKFYNIKSSVIVIIRLILSLLVQPKVVTLSGFFVLGFLIGLMNNKCRLHNESKLLFDQHLSDINNFTSFN